MADDAATDERFTPPEVLEWRDAVWSAGADTDPAWHPRSFSTAALTYTRRQNGLAAPWYGRVWLNPPWSDPGPWIDRLLAHVRQLPIAPGLHPEGMLCVRNDPSTAWWADAWRWADAVAFLSERTRYWMLDEAAKLVECGVPSFTSVVFYYGPNAAAFVDTAEAWGHYPVGLRNDRDGRTIRRMARSAKRGKPDVLAQMVKETIATFARANPKMTLADVAGTVPGGEALVLSLQVRDLWPAEQPSAPTPKNGASKRSRKPTAAPTRAAPKNGVTRKMAQRVEEIQKWIGKRTELRASEVMDAFSISRQTALRALANVPNLRAEGKAKSAKYVVVK